MGWTSVEKKWVIEGKLWIAFEMVFFWRVVASRFSRVPSGKVPTVASKLWHVTWIVPRRPQRSRSKLPFRNKLLWIIWHDLLLKKQKSYIQENKFEIFMFSANLNTRKKLTFFIIPTVPTLLSNMKLMYLLRICS